MVYGLQVGPNQSIERGQFRVAKSDVKLDIDETERQESNIADFALRREVQRLMAHLQAVENGRIERIEVRAGIPRRLIIERRAADRILR